MFEFPKNALATLVPKSKDIGLLMIAACTSVVHLSISKPKRESSPSESGSLCTGRGRFGLTLIETVVVIAIIGVLSSLLIIAVNRNRSSSREVACRNNLRQFAIASLSYETAKQHLPPGTLGFGRIVPFGPFYSIETSEVYRKKVPHASFQGILLPFMEQESLSKRLPATMFRVSATNPVWYAEAEGFAEVSSNGPAYSRCPSDSLLNEYNESIVFGTHPVWQNSSDLFSGEFGELLPDAIRPVSGHHGTNYAGCSGVYAGQIPDVSSGLRGSMSAGDMLRISQIRDGASNTYLIGETLGFRWEDRRVRMSWLVGGLVRARGDIPADESPAAFAGITNLYLGNHIYSPLSAFGSMHPDIVNFAMVDGSTAAVSREIDWFVHLRQAAIADAGVEVWGGQ